MYQLVLARLGFFSLGPELDSAQWGGGPKTHHKKPGHRPELMKTQGQLDPVEEKN